MKSVFFLTILFCAVPLFADLPSQVGEPVKVTATLNKPGAVYRTGEEILVTLGIRQKGGMTKGNFLDYRLYIDGNLQERKTVSADKDHTIYLTLEKPGWVSVVAAALDSARKEIPWKYASKNRWSPEIAGVCEGIGALVEPERFTPALPEPEDFTAYWQKQREELARVPMNVRYTELDTPPEFADVRFADVKADCAGGTPMTGYLCMPKKAAPKSLPAIVYFRGWGFYSSVPHLFTGKTAIAFELNAHGIENGRDRDFYKAYFRGHLGNYQHLGKTERDSYYFRGIYFRVMRALEYVKSLPEWNERDLFVYGGSKGGAQALAAAGLDEDVSLCVAFVPAMCDHAGVLAGRQSGWPELYTAREGKPSDEKVAATAQYYDNVNFARHIQCPVYLSTGLADDVCAPSSVYTVYNTLKGEKHIELFPIGKHNSKIPAGVRAMQKVLNP